MVVSFCLGLYDLSALPLFMYQKDNLKLPPQFIQVAAGLISIPWCVKPLFGYIIDNLRTLIGKSKYIIIVSALLRMALFSFFAHFHVNIYVFYALVFGLTLCSLFENIIAESSLVISTKRENERNPHKTANHLPIFFGFRATGSLIGNFFGGRMMKAYSSSAVFFTCSAIPIIVIAVVLVYRELTAAAPDHDTNWRSQISAIKALLFRERVFQLVIFICLLNLTPNLDSLYTFYLTDRLNFTTEDLADCLTSATICYIVGLLLYSFKLKSLNPKTFFICTNFLQWLVNLSFLLVVLGVIERWGMNNKVFCLLNWGLFSLIGELNFMPILAIWCGVCPKNLEATSITLFTGLINVSSNLSNYAGAFLIWAVGYRDGNYDQMWNLLIVQNSYLLLACVAVAFIEFPDPRQSSKKSKKNENSKNATALDVNIESPCFYRI